eukprot:796385-Rhodomonas_salina.1
MAVTTSYSAPKPVPHIAQHIYIRALTYRWSRHGPEKREGEVGGCLEESGRAAVSEAKLPKVNWTLLDALQKTAQSQAETHEVKRITRESQYLVLISQPMTSKSSQCITLRSQHINLESQPRHPLKSAQDHEKVKLYALH